MEQASLAHFDPVSIIVFWVTCIYCLSIAGQFFAKYFNQPPVLGELLMGLLFGNIGYYLHVPEISFLREGLGELHLNADINLIKISYVLDIFSRYGLIYLLFMVGLESSWGELRKVGKPALQVATIGVIAPIMLGIGSIALFYPQYGFHTELFVAATLSATSVGITARVLKDLKKIRNSESKIILGAAMIDDVLGLFILAIVSSIILNGHFSSYVLLKIFGSSLVFFVTTIYLGPKMIRSCLPLTRFLEPWEAKLVIAFVFLMLLSWVASLLQLSTIIGAFTAGLIMDDALFEEQSHRSTHLKIKELVGPLQCLLAPLFFFMMGMQVKIETFFSIKVLGLALFLSLIAIIGKLIGGLGASKKCNRLFIGVGMIPRGEVGLIFAAMGRSLHVVTDHMFAAIFIMVILTTIISPPWMKYIVNKSEM